jgi:hypothetical protein
MRGHTPEPWAAYAAKFSGIESIAIAKKDIPKTERNRAVAVISPVFISDDEDIANARRIVACVNACSGIPLEVLESPGYSVKAELDSLDEQIRLRFEAEKNLSTYRHEIEKLNESIRAVLGE